MPTVRLIVILVAVIPNPTERLTTSPLVQLNDKVVHSHLYGAPNIVPFNYVKFAAEYKLLLMCAKNYQICFRRFKDKSKNVRRPRFFGPHWTTTQGQLSLPSLRGR